MAETGGRRPSGTPEGVGRRTRTSAETGSSPWTVGGWCSVDEGKILRSVNRVRRRRGGEIESARVRGPGTDTWTRLWRQLGLVESEDASKQQ